MVFDWVDPSVPNYKPNQFVYPMIEKMLPKAAGSAKDFKLLELWAHDPTPRKGWLKYREEVQQEAN